jgi:hypothetical protein
MSSSEEKKFYSKEKFWGDLDVIIEKVEGVNSFLTKRTSQAYGAMKENSGQQRKAICCSKKLLNAITNSDTVPLLRHLILRSDLKDECALLGVSAIPSGLTGFVAYV